MPRDLFDIFPDLPWPRHRSVSGGHEVGDVQMRAMLAHARMAAAVAARQRLAAQIRRLWRQEMDAMPRRSK